MVKAPPSSEAILFSPALHGRDEMNLADLPIALLADRAPKGQKTLYFENQHGRLTITGSDAYGLPTAIDSDVIIALIYLTKIRNNFRDEKVNFSRYELIRLMNWADEGGSYKRLDESFNRWMGVSLVYDGCWWNNRLKIFTDAKMHIIESVEILDSDARRKVRHGGQGGLPLSYFLWNRTFIGSCQDDNLRQLDLDTYFSLKSAISKRLYRFLGKRFYLQPDCVFDLKEIAFERVGLSRSYAGNAAKIKEKLQASLEELEGKTFLKPMSKEDRYQRLGRGEWKIRLARQPDLLAAPALSPLVPPAPLVPPLVAELIARGVGEKAACELVQKHPAEAITAKIEIFDWLDKNKDKRVVKNPAGYLVKSITDGYGVPKGFKNKAEEAERIRQEAEADRKAAEKRRLKQETDNRERAEAKAITDYLAKLTAAQLNELDKAAFAQADPESLKMIEPGPMQKYGLSSLRRQYVGQLLKRQAQAMDAAPSPAEAHQDSEMLFRLSN